RRLLEPSKEQGDAQSSRGGPMRCLIMLADDYDDGSEIYAFYLRRQGFDVTELATGDGLLALAIESQPEVMVLDLTLPGVDGWTLITQLRAHPLTRHIPIVVLSARAYPEDERRALALGADAFLRKPCPPPALVEA